MMQIVGPPRLTPVNQRVAIAFNGHGEVQQFIGGATEREIRRDPGAEMLRGINHLIVHRDTEALVRVFQNPVIQNSQEYFNEIIHQDGYHLASNGNLFQLLRQLPDAPPDVQAVYQQLQVNQERLQVIRERSQNLRQQIQVNQERLQANRERSQNLRQQIQVNQERLQANRERLQNFSQRVQDTGQQLNEEIQQVVMNIVQQRSQEEAAETLLSLNPPFNSRVVLTEEQFKSQVSECVVPEHYFLVGKECPICLDDFSGHKVTAVLPKCGHTFHIPCVKKWLMENSSKCPLCRELV